MRTLPLILLLACGGSDGVTSPDETGDEDDILTFGDDDDDGSTDTDTDTSSTTLTGDFNGTLPPIEIAAPDFSAQNRDESLRSKDDLLGHPTVLWFFPFAGTPG
jgi:hypothetical protein